ncbi:non-structural maintenance of chromosomes element 1 homolog [Lepeophtheirus salmonis]|uniref:Non-structural maintenance of chromosomes element 1 homolog n=1 Tax=Lepeophtheirus salmonis TaxID=72036 RepID=A0A0K2TM79_LEPSM|nr:non-structural maintenance of chromosomes element 1 homolog [Lepeophtheirus salmonis]XP_040568291.1 non-structural maintenance of chromosomes element 1 homolog [Lepeophtheirus salmonis]
MVVAMEYDDRHRIFLQGIMNLGIVSGSTARKLLQKACNISGHTVPTDTGEINKTLRALTDGINREIRPLNLSIVKAIDENKIKKETYFVLINQLDRSQEFTELTKRSMVEFAPHELELLKILIGEMMKGPELEEESDSDEETESNDGPFTRGEIERTRALNLGGKVKSKNLKPLEVEEILDKFIEKNWLRSLENDVICFTPRFIAEMETYLRFVYPNDVLTCSLCNKLVIKALSCTCSKHFHLYCLGNAAPKGQNLGELTEISCPKCKHPIPLTHSLPTQSQRRKRSNSDE